MRILIIEDQTEVNSFLKVNLENECFVVDSTNDGKQGLFLALTNEYDLIILDNDLVSLNGAIACQIIREKKKAVKILILSITSDTAAKVEMLNIGADDYLTKPFSFEELLARSRALLRRPFPFQEELLTLDNLTLDNKRHLVTRNNVPIQLTRKEFMLLQYLLCHSGEVVTRGALLEHVWDMNADPFSNTIETHILTLRKKIDHPFNRKLIHTIPGRGYKISLLK